MLRTIITYGATAGLIAGGALSVFVLGFGHAIPGGMVIGYLTMLLAFATIPVAIRRQREAQGGVIRFWPAFGLGLGISLVAGLFYVAMWEASCGITGIDFARDYANGLIAHKRASGASAAELARFEREMADFRTSYANPLWRWSMTFMEIFPVGLVVSLISAAALRYPRFRRRAVQPAT